MKCPHCDAILKNKRGLKSHWGQKHKYVVESSSDDDEDEEGEDEDDSDNDGD